MNGEGKLVMDSIIETKAITILQSIQGLRGDLHIAFEEGTWAAWLYDCMSSKRLMYSVETDPPGKKSDPLELGSHSWRKRSE